MSEKREELEAVATEEVQRAGLNSLSFRTLADRVGIKSSSVHYYFPEKGDLASAIIERYHEAFAQKLAAIGRRQLGPRRKLEAFADIFVETAEEGKFCLCGMLAAEAGQLTDESRRRLSEYFEQTESWLRALLEQHAGRLTLDIEPAALARIIMSGLEGALLLDRIDGRQERLKAQRKLIGQLVA